MQQNLKRTDLHQNEVEVDSVLQRIENIIDETGVITHIKREQFFNDEPKIYDFCTFYKTFNCASKEEIATAGGTDLNRKLAILKSLGEAIERHCLSIQKKEKKGSYKELKNKAINIFEFNNSNKNHKKFSYTENDTFFWCSGYNLTDLKEVLIPSQLISVPYKYDNKEKTIREPISTGTALGSSLGGSIYRGICEIIERDAFMVAYLNKKKGKVVNLKRSGRELKDIWDMCTRYKLEPVIIDITSDLEIPSMIGVIIDKTRLGPAITVGLSADLDPKTAAIKSIKEAFHSRPWIRKLIIQNNNNTDINSFEGRALYWAKTEMISSLNFLIKGKKQSLTEPIKLLTIKEKNEKIFNILKNKNLSTFFVNLTTKEVAKHNLHVTKVIIPKLVPLYLDEKFREIYSDNERLIKPLNKIPHPFL